jgi:hypothetical protein
LHIVCILTHFWLAFVPKWGYCGDKYAVNGK